MPIQRVYWTELKRLFYVNLCHKTPTRNVCTLNSTQIAWGSTPEEKNSAQKN